MNSSSAAFIVKRNELEKLYKEECLKGESRSTLLEIPSAGHRPSLKKHAHFRSMAPEQVPHALDPFVTCAGFKSLICHRKSQKSVFHGDTHSKCDGRTVVCTNCFFSHVRELHWPLMLWIIQSCTHTLSCFFFFFLFFFCLTPGLKTSSEAAWFMWHRGFDTVSIAFEDLLPPCLRFMYFYVLQRTLCKETEVNKHCPSPIDTVYIILSTLGGWQAGCVFSLEATP